MITLKIIIYLIFFFNLASDTLLHKYYFNYKNWAVDVSLLLASTEWILGVCWQ